MRVDAVRVAAYEFPLEEPEADGTLEWSSTTMVVGEACRGGGRGVRGWGSWHRLHVRGPGVRGRRRGHPSGRRRRDGSPVRAVDVGGDGPGGPEPGPAGGRVACDLGGGLRAVGPEGPAGGGIA